MKSARFLAVAAVLGAAAFAGAAPARAQDANPPEGKKDDRPVSSDDAAKQAIARFEADFKGADIGRKMGALQSLARTKNDLVTERIGKLLGHPEPEVRMGAVMVLDSMYQNEDLAGEIVRKYIASDREKDDEVMINCMLTLGRLKHVKAIDDMGQVILKHEFIFVKIEGLKAYAKMKDKRALLPILDLWLVNPQGYSWEGGSVSVDTGAAGDADQKAAEAAYKAKYGNQQRHGAPPAMLKTYIQQIVETVREITGEKMEKPTDLMRWLLAHEKELPFKLPGKVKTTLDEFEARAKKREEGKKK
jgi:hypothetical protein